MKLSPGSFYSPVAAACAGALVGATLSFGALAQAWPSRPITWLYPFGESAATVWVRGIASEMSKSLGQPVLIENRPGAGGRVGMNALIIGKPDGYLISIAIPSMLAYQPLTSPTFKIEPVKNYTPVTQIYHLKMTLYAGAKVPFNDVKGMLDYARGNPGKLNFGSTGNGSTGHFAVEMINTKAGVKITHIPYKGEGDQVAAALAGDIQLFLTSSGPKPQVDAGRLQVLATSGETRSKSYPDRPTMRETGLDLVILQWMGVVAPPGLPADIANKLNSAIRAAMKEPAVMKAADTAGVEPLFDSSPEAFLALIRSDLKTLEPIVKQTGIVTE
ncbi:MAG: tripartite tricarboxylate transporter substrate binding protein [Betaproteobacteria bacterium]|nr:tripartite tricarboxylate transporter substrate binding protein [Betaproteobacteria bacterium]